MKGATVSAQHKNSACYQTLPRHVVTEVRNQVDTSDFGVLLRVSQYRDSLACHLVHNTIATTRLNSLAKLALKALPELQTIRTTIAKQCYTLLLDPHSPALTPVSAVVVSSKHDAYGSREHYRNISHSEQLVAGLPFVLEEPLLQCQLQFFRFFAHISPIIFGTLPEVFLFIGHNQFPACVRPCWTAVGV